jgi:hypothetical protein
MNKLLDAVRHAFAAAVAWLKSHVWVVFSVAGLLVVAGLLALLVILSQSKGVTVTVTPPPPRELTDSSRVPPLSISFDASAARIELVGKDITQSVSLSPKIPGAWTWTSDTSITFFPSEDWEPGVQYTASFAPSLFSDKVRIRQKSVSFRAAPFTAQIVNAEFYIDPVRPDIKRISAMVRFTHPVKVEEFAKAVKLNIPFTITYDKYFATAYIVTENIPVPDKAYDVKLSIAGRFSSVRGGVPFTASFAQGITIPGKYDYASLQGLESSLLRDESYEYRKILVLSSNLGMQPDQVARSIEATLLPKDRAESPGAEAEKDHEWAPEEIDAAVLAAGTRLDLTAQPVEGDYGKDVSFSFNAPSDRFVFVEVKKQIEAFGGYVIKPGLRKVVRVAPIPRQVEIMHEGSILSLSGERKLSLFSNDLGWVQFEIGRIIPDQLNNLITQTHADIRNLTLDRSYGFGLENLSSIYQETRRLQTLEPGQIQYFSFDFDSYLSRETDPRLKYGLFHFKVSEYDPETKKPTGVSTSRLILVTDLGVLVKKSVAGGFDVFVQSVHSGSPVGGASVSVIGKNGLSVLSVVTAPDGHAAVPSLEGFTREKTPQAFVVTRGSDMSFLPVQGQERFLNFSRFDIGGLYGTADPGFIDAYLFSDRGIYRPGDLMNFGVIVKAGDWGKNLAGLPLELSVQDPRGLEIQKQKISLSSTGFEQYSFRTDETAQTGKYELSLYIARDKEDRKLLGSTSVKVEEFLPDRLSIRSSFSGDGSRAWVTPEDLKATVALSTLYGTPAADSKVEAVMSLSPAALSFPAYPDYLFFDPLGAGKTFEDTLPAARTDESGSAVFPMNLERFDKSTFLVRFAADGFEKQGGRGVHTEAAIVVSPLASVVGYKPDGRLDYIYRNAARTVNFVSLGADRAPVPLSKLTMRITEIRFVSVLEKGPDKLYRYASVEKKLALQEKAFAVPRAGATVSLPTETPGDYELTVEDADGVKLSTLRFSVIGSGNLARSLDRNAELQIRLDKSDYAAGDTIRVSLKAPYTGSGLITIERDKVYAYKWFTSDTSATVQTITVPDSIEGTAYVNVSYVRSIDSKEIFTSPLSYGVVPVTVNRGARSNRISLKAEAEVLAGSLLSITYSSEKPGRVVVFGVDEGILQVARYTTPRPLDHFFAKRALEVGTSQILDLILPEYSVIQAVSAMGGDEGAGLLGRNLNPFKRKNKAPVVFWSGILAADATERTVSYRVPDYFNGTMRIMAVEVSGNAIGVQETRTLVRNHFVISPNVPTVVTPGDQFEVGVSVMNNQLAGGKDTSVRIALKASDQFDLVSGNDATESIGAQKEKTVFFTLRAKSALGAGTLSFTAAGGGLSSSLEESASIRPATPFRTQLDTGRARGKDAEVPLTRAMYPDFRSITVTASPLPLALTGGLKAYLDSYPYGCTEQIVSRAFAVLALKRVPDFSITDVEAQTAFDRAQKVLRARQNQGGSFGLWAANENVSDFVTAYAMHYLTEARAAGYAVDQGLFNQGLDGLRQIAGGDPKFEHTTPRAAAYAIYVLTRNGVVTTSYINALRESKALGSGWKQGPVAIYLAGAYALMKQMPEARTLLNGAFSGSWAAVLWDDYYTDLSQSSLCLYIASRHVPDVAGSVADKSIDMIVADLTDGKFNTISSSYATLALSEYAASWAAGAQKRLTISAKSKDSTYEALKLTGNAILRAEVPYGSPAVKVSDPTADAIYYQVVQAGFDLEPPKETAKNGIEAFREYTDADGKPIGTVRIGSEVRVHVRIRAIDSHRPTIGNIAIVDMLPSGFELSYDRAESGTIGEGSLRVDFVEPREDRVLIFCTAESSVRDFTYTIRAVNKGRFAVPPVLAESMYDRKVWTQHPSEGYIVVGD